MPYRRRASYGRNRGRSNLVVVNSIKNIVFDSAGIDATRTGSVIARAVDTPASATVPEQVSQGCIIKAFWISLDVCGLGGTGVLNNAFIYLLKNPGDSLTPPLPGTEGTSNEKKFIVKEWHAMIMRNQDGNVPYHWEGWIKLPRRYHRMGTDDTWSLQLATTAALTGHFSAQYIYKWYR